MITHYYNGIVHTMGDVGTCSEICIDDTSGKVIAVGEACGHIKSHTQVDLKGKCMVPGFCDSHLHVVSLGQSMEMVDLSVTGSISEAINALRYKLEQENPPILRGYGWNQDNWFEGRFPLKSDLDLVATDRPVIITRVCGHIMCTNSFALDAMDIDIHVPVEGGSYGTLDDGSANGLFYENARKRIYEYIPRQSVDSLMKSIQRAHARLVSQGICSVHSNDVRYGVEPHFENVWEAYRRLEKEGLLYVRTYHQNLVYSLGDIHALLASGLRTGSGSDWSRQGPYKIMLDGSLGGRTAYLGQPYKDDPSNRGILCFTSDEIRAFYELVDQEKQQFIIHAIGDGAMKAIFDAYGKGNPDSTNPFRHGIVHCQITSQEILEAFRRYNMHGYIQPIFLDYDSRIVIDRVGVELAATSYNWRYFYDEGINAPMGSDAPIETTDVIKGIYTAVARKRLDGLPDSGYYPELKLSLYEALYGYTVAPAIASFEEDIKGKLMPGYHGDVTLLDSDVLACTESEILKIKVLGTLVGGRLVYGEELSESNDLKC